MISRTIVAAVLTTALMTGVVSAQTTTANKADRATIHRDGEWRASKLVGLNVYNEASEKIGDINEVILDKSGKTSKVILGVGGFLGMGEYNVAVPFEKLKWANEPVRSAASTANPPASAPATNVDSNARTASDGAARTTTGTATNTSTIRQTSHNWYPDHAVYNATKDQLKAMPEFKY
jgi:sporulation protein YlmC with PRC-barrel domain